MFASSTCSREQCSEMPCHFFGCCMIWYYTYIVHIYSLTGTHVTLYCCRLICSFRCQDRLPCMPGVMCCVLHQDYRERFGIWCRFEVFVIFCHFTQSHVQCTTSILLSLTQNLCVLRCLSQFLQKWLKTKGWTWGIVRPVLPDAGKALVYCKCLKGFTRRVVGMFWPKTSNTVLQESGDKWW